MFADALPQLADDKKAVAAAYSMLDRSPRNCAPEGVKAQSETAKTLQLLGKAIKAAAPLWTIERLVVQIVDGVVVVGRRALVAAPDNLARVLLEYTSWWSHLHGGSRPRTALHHTGRHAQHRVRPGDRIGSPIRVQLPH